jgi:acyl-CoA synthetase (AMP-forming)/AMP-acid ligase II
LQSDAVVALQLANTVESVVALLAILRAGMIAAPLPLLWRKQDIVRALRPLGVKAIVTTSRIGSAAHIDLAMQVAAELFPVRYVCSFGRDLPDGVVPLDGVFAAASDVEQAPARLGNAAPHIAVVTFDEGTDGIRTVARTQRELIAGGLGPYLESGAPIDDHMLSAIPLGSFAGLSLTLLPWLLGGGTLNLHHAFDPDTFSEQARGQDGGGGIVVPGPVLAALHDANGLGRPARVVALWRSPESLGGAPSWRGDAVLVDVASFGEVGLIASRRDADGFPAAIPAGAIGVPQRAPAAMPICETQRGAAGTLMMRGAMVPTQAFPPGAEDGFEPHLAVDELDFVDTGWPCKVERASNGFTITAPPAGSIAIGGYRFKPNEAEAVIAAIDADATIVALPDAVLGQRLAGRCADPVAIISKLQARGLNPLIGAAFRPRHSQNAV